MFDLDTMLHYLGRAELAYSLISANLEDSHPAMRSCVVRMQEAAAKLVSFMHYTILNRGKVSKAIDSLEMKAFHFTHLLNCVSQQRT